MNNKEAIDTLTDIVQYMRGDPNEPAIVAAITALQQMKREPCEVKYNDPDFEVGECSNCGEEISANYAWNYCPNCGRKLEAPHD